MAHTVIGIFEKINRAEEAAQYLIDNGFSSRDVDISHQNSNVNAEESRVKEEDSITRFFKSLFGESDESKKYSTLARRGTVITVHTSSKEESERAANILDEYGALNADEHLKEYSGNTLNPNTDRPYIDPETEGANSSRISNENRPSNENNLGGSVNENRNKNISENMNQAEGKSIPIIQEEMAVGKREVETGGIRVRSRIVEKPVEEQLRLRKEHVFVERTPVNRPATEADLKNFKETTIEATEHSEVPVVGKEARVVEEVKIKKEVEERNETIRGSVRRQDVDVDKKKKDRERTDKGKDDVR